jgi:murein L,D-transpeptidase YcbB/YkuD
MIHQNLLNRSITAFLVGVIAVAGSVFSQPSDRDVLRERIEWLSSTPNPSVDGAPIAAVLLITKLYERRGYEPAWTDPAMVKELFDQVLRSVEHGLNPDDFHATQLGTRLNPGPRANDPVFAADTEILCTDALARLAVTLQFGKLDPTDLDPAWNFSREIARQDPVEVFNEVLETKTVAARLAATEPQTGFYRRFRKALIEYRAILAEGSWSTVPAGPVLQVDSVGPRVAALRTRLRVTGDLAGPDPADPEVFDEDLEAAVKHAQMRH